MAFFEGATVSLPIWATDPSSLLISEEEYEALPAEVCKTIEVVDGRVIFCESPSPEHQQVSLNLANALRAARPDSPCLNVLPGTDMRYVRPHAHRAKSGRRFTIRRPDLTLHYCLERGARLTSDMVLTAIEITSSNDEVDFNDKRAEYAAQGIPTYLIVVMGEGRITSVEEHRLDWSGRNYQLSAVHHGFLATTLPENVKLSVSFDELTSI